MAQSLVCVRGMRLVSQPPALGKGSPTKGVSGFHGITEPLCKGPRAFAWVCSEDTWYSAKHVLGEKRKDNLDASIMR